MPKHHHRAGPLKQSNKRNKRSKASKRSQTRLAGGKVDDSSSNNRRGTFNQQRLVVAHNKADRRHHEQQKRNAKRAALIRKKRGMVGGGHSQPPPRVVGIISLGSNGSSSGSSGNTAEVVENKLRDLILGEADHTSPATTATPLVTAKFGKHKKDGNLTILTNSAGLGSYKKKTTMEDNSNNNNNNNNDDGDNDAAVFAALDLCRVCDIVLFVVDADGQKEQHHQDVLGMSVGGGNGTDDLRSHASGKTSGATSSSSAQSWDYLISERGDRILTAVKSQGLPQVATILARTETDAAYEGGGFDDVDDDHMTTHSTRSAKSVRRGNLKRNADVKKYISRFATTEFGADNDKVMEVNLTEDSTASVDQGMDQDGSMTTVGPQMHAKRILAASLVRALCTMSASPSNWISNLPRNYILSENRTYNPETEELHITGYVRGMAPFDVNALVHVPNLGTYACKALRRATNPNARDRKKGTMETEQDYSDDEVVESDPIKRESLEQFATPDALEGEQNLIGFDEAQEDLDEDMHDSDAHDNDRKAAGFARPTGWSDYQSAWLDAVDQDEVNHDDDFDHGELAKELNKKSSSSVATNVMDLDDANDVTAEERQALLEQRRKQQHEHHEFPDEVQVNEDENARDRFARYRSLKSFKKSYWDPKENLPDSFASVFNFSSFKSTQRAVMAEMKDLIKASEDCNGQFWNGEKKDRTGMDEDTDDEDDFLEGCVPAGSYISITLEGVKESDYSSLPAGSPLTAVSLLPHENKVSVLHMGLSSFKDASSETPVKSKDKLIFRCGWRTWTGRPVFSQNNLNCDKHKFERFLPDDSFFAASVFGPVTYTPCPVLVFRELNGRKELVASGSMIGADADRIIVKRVILTGYPVRVHKRFATVKYMFYDPEDVKWFKPAGLTTKHGLNGKIEESVGEHGTMKCLFNAPIKQHDTVCLCLYKRVFPKLCIDPTKDSDEGGTVRSTRGGSETLVVR